MDDEGRDTAASASPPPLTAQGHPDTALTFLAEQESQVDRFDKLRAQRVAALACSGDLAEAQALVDARTAGPSAATAGSMDEGVEALARRPDPPLGIARTPPPPSSG